jgi:hypothetical protein
MKPNPETRHAKREASNGTRKPAPEKPDIVQSEDNPKASKDSEHRQQRLPLVVCANHATNGNGDMAADADDEQRVEGDDAAPEGT